ncbi:hypothetical protein [Halalkalibacter sp. APA_J-10(15)]|uniref:hypothetical protein n=1 Tax=unclassified Halalkalibacter TaxID=2893063 RepID=UPI001FF4DE9C|nr:hypothetical protein [Halalkalibacter sp. APA_J-10(15)]MCK0471512.1 hypothetical protein [Halalkalibacter sp. APA_J-10(15)]
MNKWKYAIALLSLSFFVGLFLVFSLRPEPLRETLIFFPIDESAQFLESRSAITISSSKDEDEYILNWETSSLLDQEAFLRQDVSLLFEDGLLKDIQSTWKKQTDSITMNKHVPSDDSGHYRVVTFHHAEIHYPNDHIRSAQALSFDRLYVVDSPLSPLEAFRIPETEQQWESKRVLDYILQQQQQYDWEDLFEYYHLPEDEYVKIPLTDFIQYEQLPGLTREESQRFLGGLWEGLYKHYILGIAQEDGTVSSPIGSTVPLILLPKTTDHFFILFRTPDGNPVQFIQTISS